MPPHLLDGEPHAHARPAHAASGTPGEPLRIGIGGPVGSGKTALVAALCRQLRDELSLAVLTNDIYTTEDADFLRRHAVLPDERIAAVQTGGCPHTAIRDDITANLDAIDDLIAGNPGARPDPRRVRRRQPDRDLLLGSGRRPDLRRRRGRRRQGAPQGRPRRDVLGSVGDQQDRPRPDGRRRPRRDAPRRRHGPRRPAVRADLADRGPGGDAGSATGCASNCAYRSKRR